MSEQPKDEEQKLYPWGEGLPTKPDVDLLLKTWPNPKAGDRFEYESIEALLHIDRDANRFRTVTTQWRKRLLDAGVVIECQTGIAFYVASVEEVLANTYYTFRWASRKLRKQRRKLSVQQPKTDQQRAEIEHNARLLNANERDLKKARMNLILPATAAPAAPQIAPPTKKSGEGAA